MSDADSRREQLIHKLVKQRGVFTFFPPGEEKPLAHHQSQRRPVEVYAGAALSPYFCNFRTASNAGGKQGTLDASSVELIGDCLLDAMLRDGQPLEAIAGIPNAGDPIAESVAAAARRRGILLKNVTFRKSEGDGGRTFARLLSDDATAVDAVVDDVITMADVKFRFLSQLGPTVHGEKPRLYVLLDRHEGGAQILRRLGYQVTEVITIHSILQTCYALDKIDKPTLERVQEYSRARRKLVFERQDEIVQDLVERPY